MSFMTLDQLRSFASKRVASGQLGGIIKEAGTFRLGTDVFLSHSHLDEEALVGAIEFLHAFGASVYQDIDDDALPSTPSGQTAAALRDRIAKCRRFVVATSRNVRRSRWIPWELGFADARKGLKKIALLPLRPGATSEAAIEQEYLEIYPVIDFVQLEGHPHPHWCVRNPEDGRWWTLKQWLTD